MGNNEFYLTVYYSIVPPEVSISNKRISCSAADLLINNHLAKYKRVYRFYKDRCKKIFATRWTSLRSSERNSKWRTWTIKKDSHSDKIYLKELHTTYHDAYSNYFFFREYDYGTQARIASAIMDFIAENQLLNIGVA